jgi:transcriptional regulator with GAF, ATPase, and Fis domain
VNPLRSDNAQADCEDFIFASATMRQFMKRVKAIAKLDVPVLLLGETGTGKTHLGQYIHCQSKRAKQQFVKVNCPALAPTLFESELFGHAKGAFTGASTKRVGRCELAHQGTLFLDEIAELSGEMQSKLLHLLDDRRFERVGESMTLSVDTRLIAATNVKVAEAVREGRLRSDFLHRLSVCVLELPPLRNRLEDIPVLTAFFIDRLSALYSLPRPLLSPGIILLLQRHSWPGNIRELRNVISRMLLQNCIGGAIGEADVEQAMNAVSLASEAPSPQPGPSSAAGKAVFPSSLDEVQRRHILHALAQTRGVISGPRGAAAMLGLPRSTLQYRMRKLGIDGGSQEAIR